MNAKSVLFVVAVVGLLVLAALMFRSSLEQPTVPRPGAAGTPSVAPVVPPSERHAELTAGIAALEEGRADDAVQRLSAVPVTDPEYPQALIQLALAHERLGDADAAFAALDQLVEIQPEDPRSYHARSWVLYRQGRYDEAENAILRAIELASANVELRYDLGLFRLMQGDLPRAINAYTRAMNMQDERSYVLQAFDHLEQVHEERTDFADVHYAIAFFANALGQTAGERAELRHYVEANPDGPALEAAKQRLAEIEQQAERR